MYREYLKVSEVIVFLYNTQANIWLTDQYSQYRIQYHKQNAAHNYSVMLKAIPSYIAYVAISNANITIIKRTSNHHQMHIKPSANAHQTISKCASN